jgi:hypothetical protein
MLGHILSALYVILFLVFQTVAVTCQSSFSSKVTFCASDSNCTAVGLTNCLAGGCVDMRNLTVNEISFEVGKPNNVYIVFSLWDGNCHPVVWNTNALGPRLKLYENGNLQSQTESFNGLLSAPQVCYFFHFADCQLG